MFFLLFRLLCVISVMMFPFSSKLPGAEKSEALGGHEKIPLFTEGFTERLTTLRERGMHRGQHTLLCHRASPRF